MGEKHVFNKRLVFRINIKYSYLVIGRKTIKKKFKQEDPDKYYKEKHMDDKQANKDAQHQLLGNGD